MTDSSQEGLDVGAIRFACEALLRMQASHHGIVADSSDEVKVQVLYGLCQQALNHARAALAVLDAGLPVEAGVNIRAALEHAVTAQWVFLTPDGVMRLIEGAKTAYSFYDSAQMRVPLPPNLLDQIADWKALRPLPIFSVRCDDLDGTHDPETPKSGTLRFEYVRLSQATHVTSRTIAEYLSIDPLSGEVLLRQESPDRFPAANMLSLGMATAMACWVLESLRVPPNRLSEVEQIADEANIPSTLAEDYEVAKRKKGRTQH